MSSNWESTVAKIEEKLPTLKAPDLNNVCAGLGLTVDRRDKDVCKLRRQILQYIEREDVMSREDKGMSLLMQLNDLIEEQRENVSTLNATAYVASQNVSLAHPLYGRELKIIGQIGEPNQKDKLTYLSSERQIQRALKKGHDEGEVVEAVIQAMAPGTKLKSYLESKIDLTLQALRQIL